MGDCKRMVDVRLDTLPPDQPWSRVGRRLVCSECGTPATVNIVPNWHDRVGHAIPFSQGWRIADGRQRKSDDPITAPDGTVLKPRATRRRGAI